MSFVTTTKELPETTLKPLECFITEAKKNGLNLDWKQITGAYKYSQKAHQGQFRKDGKPYITHPLSVAGILVNLQLDQDSIITGLLHDVVEDTSVSLEDIQKEFGSEVAFLVDGVTKISRMKFRNIQHKQSENIRKMIVAMGKDVRVILVKLADRLHNMRTLSYMPQEKQLLVADETLEIYAPLASRLGINEIKTELEDLSFQYSNPESYSHLQKKMRDTEKSRAKYTKEVIRQLKKKLSQSLKGNFEVQGRYKNFYSIYCKMRNHNLNFDQIHDVLGFRILVEQLYECYEALGLIHTFWKPVPGRFKDFIAIPKVNNYQSLHTTVIGPKGLQIEVQIRTKEMHLTAERGIAAHWIYKSNKKEKMTGNLEKFNWLKDLAAWYQQAGDSNEFLDNIKRDLFESEIYVFTPAGDIKEFPKGATPIDFAYAIHTDIGAHVKGAKVNGRQVPLKHKLQSGDTVEISTSKTSHPTKDWLKICVTSRARSKIQAIIKSEEREKALQIGQKVLEKNCQKFKVSEKSIFTHPRYPILMKDSGFNKKEDLYIALGFGRLTAANLFKELNKHKEKEKSFPLFEKKSGGEKTKNTTQSAILVEGNDQIMVSFARCCYPVSGDSIRAYISWKKGIVVHRSQCAALLAISPDRFIEVNWKKEEKSQSFYEISIQVLCGDSPGALNDMSEAFTVLGLNITDVRIIRKNDQKAFANFTTKVRDIKQLQELTSRLRAIENVISVKRKADTSNLL